MGTMVYSLLWVMQDLYHQSMMRGWSRAAQTGTSNPCWATGARTRNRERVLTASQVSGYGLSGSELKLQAWSKVRGSLLRVLRLG